MVVGITWLPQEQNPITCSVPCPSWLPKPEPPRAKSHNSQAHPSPASANPPLTGTTPSILLSQLCLCVCSLCYQLLMIYMEAARQCKLKNSEPLITEELASSYCLVLMNRYVKRDITQAEKCES